VAIAGVGGLVFSTAMYLRADRDRRAAVDAREEAAQRAAREAEARSQADAARREADVQRAAAEREGQAAVAAGIRADEQRARAEEEAYASSMAAVEVGMQGDEPNWSGRFVNTPRHLHGWEWDFLLSKADSSLATLYAPRLSKGQIGFSADSQEVVWSNDHAIFAWDVKRRMRTLFISSEDAVKSIDTSGRIALHVARNGSAAVVEIRTRRIVSRITPAERISQATFSADGTLVAAITIAGDLEVFDAATGSRIGHWPGVARDARSLQVSHGNDLVLVLSGSAVVLAPVRGGEPPRSFPAPKDSTVAVVAADSRHVFCGGPQGLRRLDAHSGADLGLLGDLRSTTSVAVSPDGTWVAAAGRSLVLLDPATGKRLAGLSLLASNSRSGPSIAFSPDGRYLAAGEDNTLMVWDLARTRLAAGVNVGGQTLSVSGDGRRVTVATAGRVAVWDFDTPAPKPVPLAGGEGLGPVTAVATSSRGSIAAGSETGLAAYWPRADSDPVMVKAALPGGAVEAVALSPDGRWLAATGGAPLRLRMWSIASQRLQIDLLAEVLEQTRGPVTLSGTGQVGVSSSISRNRWLAFDSTGTRLYWSHLSTEVQRPERRAFAFLTSVIDAFSVTTGQHLARRKLGQFDRAAMTGDGTALAVISMAESPLQPGRLELIDAGTARNRLTAASSLFDTSCAAFIARGARLGLCGQSGLFRVLNPSTGRTLLEVALRPIPIVSVQGWMDGNRVTVAYEDGVVQVLDTTSSAEVNLKVRTSIDTLFFGSDDPERDVARDPDLSPALRKEALAQLAQWRDRDPSERLARQSWSLLERPGRSPSQIRAGRAAADEALQFAPWSPEYLGLVGVAQYRAGEFQAALLTLERSLERWRAAGGVWLADTISDPSIIGQSGESGQWLLSGDARQVTLPATGARAFRAMCLARLRRASEARTEVEQVRLLSRQATGGPVLRAIVAEADAVVADAEGAATGDVTSYRRARAMVDELFASASFVADVLDLIHADRTMTAPVKTAAVRLASARIDVPSELNAAARTVVAAPGKSLADYRRALQRAQRAVELAPAVATHTTTFGWALYRLDRHRECINTLDLSVSPLTRSTIVAMARYRLGEIEEAKRLLATVQQGIRNRTDVADELTRIVAEASALIGGK
jgi:WD40 repeat protein